MRPLANAPRQVVRHPLKRSVRRRLHQDIADNAVLHPLVAVLQHLLNQLNLAARKIVVEAALGNAAARKKLGQAQTVIPLFGKELRRFCENQFLLIHIFHYMDKPDGCQVKSRGASQRRGL